MPGDGSGRPLLVPLLDLQALRHPSAAPRSPPREYRRHIALSRIFLDNVKHVRTSVLTQNEDAFAALDYGADDFDLPIEDEVTQKAGARIDLDLERLLEVPRSLGYEVSYRHAGRPPALAARSGPS